MNRQFLEFWGRALLLAAQGQEHLEALTRLLQQGLAAVPDYARIFRAAYGLDTQEADPGFPARWQQAEEDFRRSLEEYLALLGLVPREKYEALAGENARLKARVAELEETLQGLRTLVEEKGLGMEAALLQFQKLLHRQGEQWQKFLKGLAEAAKPSAPEGKEKP